MRIDAHQHFWKYDPQVFPWISEEMQVLRQDFLPDALQPQLIAHDMEASVAVQAAQNDAENDFLLGLSASYPFIKGVVGWFDLRSRNLGDQLDIYANETLLKGVRHIVHDEPDDRFLLDPDFLYGVRRLQAYNLTYDILIFPKHLEVTREFVDRLPDDFPLVIDHMAKPLIREGRIEPWKSQLKALAKFENLHIKVSGLVTEAQWGRWKYTDFRPYLDLVLEAFGPDRMMYGSDWPVCLLSAEYQEQYSLVNDYVSRLSDAEKSAIFGKTAQRFYGIPD